MPSHNLSLNNLGYTCACRARPCMRCTCLCCFPPPRFSHCSPTCLITSFEDVMMRVAFCTGASPASSTPIMPKAHMCNVVESTSCLIRNCLTSGMSQALDLSGCSCTKCRLAAICMAYTSRQNLMCALPRASSSAITFGSRLALPISCSGENAVHGEDPMTQNGCVARIIFFTLACTRGVAEVPRPS